MLFFHKKRFFYLSIHTKIVLITTITLIVLGSVMVFLFEHRGSIKTLSLYEQILSAFFTSVNFRTAGFNTLDIGAFKDGTLLFGSIFMVIGGAPGGTAGGIKVTTIAVLLVHAYCVLREKRDVIVFNKKIPKRTLDDSFLIIIVAASYIAICVTLLSFMEEGGAHGFIALVFEVCSAFGTVGVSIGDGGALSLSGSFGAGGKMLIILLMLSGRVGVLAFSFAIFTKEKPQKFQYPEGRIMI